MAAGLFLHTRKHWINDTPLSLMKLLKDGFIGIVYSEKEPGDSCADTIKKGATSPTATLRADERSSFHFPEVLRNENSHFISIQKVIIAKSE